MSEKKKYPILTSLAITVTYVFAGIILTVVIAWSAACFTPAISGKDGNGNWVSNSISDKLRMFALSKKLEIVDFAGNPNPWPRQSFERNPGFRRAKLMLESCSFGWPFRALSYRIYTTGYVHPYFPLVQDSIVDGGILPFYVHPAYRGDYLRAIPVDSLCVGLLLDSIFWAIVLFSPSVIAFTYCILRGQMRKRFGRCPVCNYCLRGTNLLQRCPECGSRGRYGVFKSSIFIPAGVLGLALLFLIVPLLVANSSRIYIPKIYQSCGVGGVEDVKQVIDDDTFVLKVKWNAGWPFTRTGLSFSNYTPLMEAVRLGNLEVVKYLISIGEPVNDATLAGWTPLLISIATENEDLIRYLLDHGADPNSVTGFVTPLKIAFEIRSFAVAKLLIESGADPLVRTRNGENAFDFAENIHDTVFREKIMVLLESEGKS